MEYNSYRNQRFEKGNTVNLYFNPYHDDENGEIDVSVLPYGLYKIIEYITSDVSDITEGDIMAVSTFGGYAAVKTGITQYQPYSNDVDFNNFAYDQTGINSVTSGAISAPFGAVANKWIPDTTSGVHECLPAINDTSVGKESQRVIHSIFAKAGEYSGIKAYASFWLGEKQGAYFDLSTGLIVPLSDYNEFDGFGMVDYGDGWYRCWYSYTFPSVDGILSGDVMHWGISNEDPSVYSYVGDDSSGLYLYGAMTQYNNALSMYIDNTTRDQIVGDGVYFKIPEDTFNWGLSSWLDKFKDRVFYFRKENTDNKISNVLITEKRILTTTARYGSYPVGYNSNDEQMITLSVQEDEFDKIRQLVMSKAIAVESCDKHLDMNTVTWYNHRKPLGGGSMNPIVRLAHVTDDKLSTNGRSRVYEITLKLLG